MGAGAGRAPAATTNWSIVLAAGRQGTAEADAALERLCEIYWYPVYAFIRHQEGDPDAARDLTQEFFARLIEKHYLQDVRPGLGRFRAFLFAAVRHFLSNERDRARASKRGGGRAPLSLDIDRAEGRYSREPSDEVTPEILFDRQWTVALLEQVLDRLRAEMAVRGKADLFSRLRGTLTGDGDEGGYRTVARALGMTEGAVKVAAHRMRQRYGELLRGEIAAIVADPAAIDAELRHLAAALTQAR